MYTKMRPANGKVPKYSPHSRQKNYSFIQRNDKIASVFVANSSNQIKNWKTMFILVSLLRCGNGNKKIYHPMSSIPPFYICSAKR